MKKNIMLVDDDKIFNFLSEKTITSLGLANEVHFAMNGKQALELLQKYRAGEISRPDIIFLDLNMPRKNGFQCLEEIRSHEWLKPIPVIILTTSINQAQIKKVYDKGAVYYFRKPTEFPILVRLIEKVLSTDDLAISRQLTSF